LQRTCISLGKILNLSCIYYHNKCKVQYTSFFSCIQIIHVNPHDQIRRSCKPYHKLAREVGSCSCWRGAREVGWEKAIKTTDKWVYHCISRLIIVQRLQRLIFMLMVYLKDLIRCLDAFFTQFIHPLLTSNYEVRLGFVFGNSNMR